MLISPVVQQESEEDADQQHFAGAEEKGANWVETQKETQLKHEQTLKLFRCFLSYISLYFITEQYIKAKNIVTSLYNTPCHFFAQEIHRQITAVFVAHFVEYILLSFFVLKNMRMPFSKLVKSSLFICCLAFGYIRYCLGHFQIPPNKLTAYSFTLLYSLLNAIDCSAEIREQKKLSLVFSPASEESAQQKRRQVVRTALCYVFLFGNIIWSIFFLCTGVPKWVFNS